jgi:hypothetical protein
MASINQNFAQGLLAAALRKGLVKTQDILTPGMYDPNLDFQQQNQALGFRQQFGQSTDPSNLETYNPCSDYNVQGSRIHEGLLGGSGSYLDPVTGQRTDYSTQGSLADLLTNKNRAEADYGTATAGRWLRPCRNARPISRVSRVWLMRGGAGTCRTTARAATA